MTVLNGLDILCSVLPVGHRDESTGPCALYEKQTPSFHMALLLSLLRGIPEPDTKSSSDTDKCCRLEEVPLATPGSMWKHTKRAAPTDDELTETDEEELVDHMPPTTGAEELLVPSQPMMAAGMFAPIQPTGRESLLPALGRTPAVQMVDSYFSFNGIQIALYIANIEGTTRVLVVPNMLVTDLVSHCVDLEAQKEARRYYSNKLLEAVGSAKAATGVYIDRIDRRNAIFTACYLDVLKDLLEAEGSPAALAWQKITTQLRNFPTNKERPRKRQRKTCAVPAN